MCVYAHIHTYIYILADEQDHDGFQDGNEDCGHAYTRAHIQIHA